MKLINPELKKKCLDFIKSITASDTVAIIHDADPDGISSCAILSRCIERLRGRPADFFFSDELRTYPESLLEQIKNKKVNKIITLDIAMEENQKAVDFLSSFADLMIIDHHKVNNKVPEKVVFVKPQLLYDEVDPSQYCTSKFVFDLCSEIADISDLDWLACVGIVADVNYRSWKDFFNLTIKKYKLIPNEDPFKTLFGRATSVISSAIFYDKKNIQETVNTVVNAKSLQEIINSDLKKYEEAVQKEISFWRSHVKDKAEFYDTIGLIYYEIEPKFEIKSVLSTLISFDNKDRTVVVVHLKEGFIGASARNQSGKVPVNDLMANAVKGLENSNGGGHVFAAAAGFMRTDLPVFKKRVIDELRGAKRV